ncbi:MAG TPA: MBL fold metallo-hydrolase [Verrucomicrobiae bacterium]|nr:MBL fold metallo-hydrolase [Verrucomicrobiae bacterium]
MQSKAHFAAAIVCILSGSTGLLAEIGKVENVATNVFFHEGDLARQGHCNNGWVVFADFILVIDGNFPSGAQHVIPKIKATSERPIRFVFDTHHHGDHAYGNRVWLEHGATPVAHVGVLAEMKKFETGFFGGPPGRWEDAAKNRKDVAASRLQPPTLLFEREMTFDDGRMRVDLRHFGVAHTRGDGFAWLPNERILFTGDACVNGPYNFMGDGDSGAWVKTLEAARALQPKVVCPGHGAMGGPEILDNQINFISGLRSEVQKLMDGGMKAAEVKAAAAMIKEALRKKEGVGMYIGASFDAQVEKVYTDLSGR